MRVVDARTQELLDPTSSRFVTGSPEEQREARAEWRRQVRARRIIASDRLEIPRAELDFQRYGIIEHTGSRDGDYYRGRIDGDPDYLPSATAYYVAADGMPVLLDPVTATPRSRNERDRIQAQREARRAAPKPKPAGMRKRGT